MAATLSDITRWFQSGTTDSNLTHMVVVCDQYDWFDYPVYVAEGEDPRKVVADHNGKNMQRVMEVYNLRLPVEDQLRPGTRVFNY